MGASHTTTGRTALRAATDLQTLVEAADGCGLAPLLDGPASLFLESVPWDAHAAAPVLHHLVDEGWASSLRDVLVASDFQKRWRRRARSAGTEWLLTECRAFFEAELAATGLDSGATDSLQLHPELDAAGVRQWAESHHVADRLALPVGVLLGRVSGRTEHHLARFPASGRILDLFAAPTAGPGARDSVWPPVPFSVKLAATDWLQEEAAAVKDVPDDPPADWAPEVSERIREWDARLAQSRARLAAATSAPAPVPLDDWAEVLGAADADILRWRPPPGTLPCTPGGVVEIRLSLDASDPIDAAGCACGGDARACRHSLWAVDSLRAALRAGQPGLVAGLDERLKAPRWSRELDLFGQVLDTGRAGVPDDAESAWLVTTDAPGALTTQPIWARAYRRREGTRTWPGRQVSDGGADGDALDQLRLLDGARNVSEELRRGVTYRVLECLVGHPRVYCCSESDPLPRRVRVVEGELGLWLGAGADSSTLHLALACNGQPVADPETLRPTLARWSADRTAWQAQNADEEVIYVARVSDAARRLLLLVLDRGPEYPRSALGTLVDRLPAFEDTVAVHIDDRIIGDAVASRPVLRCELNWRTTDTEALFLRLRVSPLPGARPRRPGLGPPRALGTLDNHPVHCFRDRAAELRLAREFVHAVGLDAPTQADARWEWTLPAPQPAFDMWLALEDWLVHHPDTEVAWDGKRPTVQTVDSPDALTVEVTPGSRRGWFRLDGALDLDATELALADLLDQARQGRRHVRLGPGQWGVLSEALQARLEELAAVARNGELPGFSGGVLDVLEELGVRIDADTRWSALRERVRAAMQETVEAPAGLRCQLRPYQKQGFEWLARLTAWGAGGVLADDMGLGKTIQALALLVHRAALGPALVVAPSSLVFNWRDEARRFAPGLQVRVYRGPDRTTQLDHLGAGVLLLTTYDILARDAAVLAQTRFASLVLDEAQAIKNPAAQRTKAVFSLVADARVALSGTPIENRLEELWSLLEAVCPGLLGPRAAFREDFILPIEGDRDEERQAALARIIRPFVLRRLKSEVATELPERVMVVQRITARADHAGFYGRERLRAVAETRQLLASEAEGAHFQVLAWLTRLRMLACHPALVDTSWSRGSAKLDHALEHIENVVGNGHAVLVFSQFTRHLDLVEAGLVVRELEVVRIDGRTTPAQREAAVRSFQAGEVRVFLLSLKAGGVGLNLTAADHVLLLDPWWNPAAEDQAADRAHRIGQHRPVTITRLVTAGTLEDDILALQADKRALVSATLSGTGVAGRLDGAELAALIQGSDALRADLDTEIPRFDTTEPEAGTEAGSEWE